MIKKIVLISILLLVAIGNAAIDQIYHTSGIWNVVEMSSAYSYVDLGENNPSNNCFGALVDGGIHNIFYSNGSWNFVAVPGSLDVKYVSITGTKETNKAFAARVDGGIDCIYYNGASWSITTVSLSGIYNDLGDNYHFNNNFFGAKAGGGIEQFFLNGGIWQSALVPGTGGVEYTSIVKAMDSYNKIFAARANGGIDQIYNSGGNWYVANIISTGNYVDLADNVATNSFFAVKKDGTVNQVYYSSGTWQTSTIHRTIGKNYITIVAAPDVSNKFFAARVPEPRPTYINGNSPYDPKSGYLGWYMVGDTANQQDYYYTITRPSNGPDRIAMRLNYKPYETNPFDAYRGWCGLQTDWNPAGQSDITKIVFEINAENPRKVLVSSSFGFGSAKTWGTASYDWPNSNSPVVLTKETFGVTQEVFDTISGVKVVMDNSSATDGGGRTGANPMWFEVWDIRHYGTHCGSADRPNVKGDITGDCIVNLEDFAAMAKDWVGVK